MKEEKLKNIASERAVLSGIVKYGRECFLEVGQLVKEGTFTLDQNRVLFRCLAKAFESSDKVGLTEILSSAQILNLSEYAENKEFQSHLKGVLNTHIDQGNILDHGKRLKRLEFARRLQSELREIYLGLNKITGEESLTSILSIAEKPIQDTCLSFIREDDLTPKQIGDDIEEYIESLRENKGKSIGIPSGFAYYDECIGGGLRRKSVDLVAARMKTGKSVFADNVALHVSTKHNIPVLMLDTEMSKFDHHNRLLANLSGIEINAVAKGEFYDSREKVDIVKKAGGVIKSMPYDYINISGQEIDSVLSIMKRWILKRVGYDENGRTNDCLIVYDYLKLMTSKSITNNVAEHQALGFQITQLHNFMVENDCACLAFVQLNRDGITKETTDVLADSDRLARIATSISIFKDKTDEEKASDGIRNGNKKLIPIAARNGPGIGDNGYICLNMEGEFARLTELGMIRDVKKHADNQKEGFANSDPENEDDEESVRPF